VVEAVGHAFVKILPREQVSGIPVIIKNLSGSSVIFAKMSGSSVNCRKKIGKLCTSCYGPESPPPWPPPWY
jgi:hypothetical protein